MTAVRVITVDGVVYVAAEDIEAHALATASAAREAYDKTPFPNARNRFQAVADTNDAIRNMVAEARQAVE